MKKIRLTPTNVPHGGAVFSSPAWRKMPIGKIETILQEDFKSYADAGYNSFTFHRPTGTVSIRKVKIETMENIFETDIYGLLNEKK